MKIGIVTTWFERGAAYVSRIYMDLLEKEGHEVLIYARGGQNPPKDMVKWNEPYVTRDNKYQNSRINQRLFFSWIKKNNIQAILFNEQQDFRIVAETKKVFPGLKIGAYVDYYTERTIPWFELYDFVICNTHRHMQAMQAHPQAYYIQWGTDIDLYKPTNENHDTLTFFHSVGMSTRKGTDVLIDAFINGECYKDARLVIHTQIPIERVCKYDRAFLKEKNIDLIEKTVTAPGLYYMGDVYVYPTRLDGLGLTMYEAIASGLPVITTNFPPMNEAINESIGKLVEVKDYYCRQDAYYFPMVICDEQALIECMKWYIDHPQELAKQKIAARQYAEKHYDISVRERLVSEVFENAEIRSLNMSVYNDIKYFYKKEINPFYQFTNNNTALYDLKCNLLKLLSKIKK